MKTITLNNGMEMPILGFGVYQISDASECEKAVSEAIQVGYRLIDTASAYVNETAVGAAVSASGVPREELCITTKLWVQDAGYDNTLRAFDKSMGRLGLDYLDLYLIHQPFGDYYGSWRAMEKLYREGCIRAIGVCNFYPDRLVDLCDHNEVIPAINQIETHPIFQRNEEHTLMVERGIQHQAWASFAEGRRDMFQNPVLREIGDRYGKSVAQVILRWLIQREVVVIPKSVHRERMEENFNVFDFELTEADMLKIADLDTGKGLFMNHRDPAIASRLGNLTFDIIRRTLL